MATAADLVNETLLLLESGSRSEYNLLAATINSSVTSLDVAYAIGGIQKGAIIWIDLEAMMVTASAVNTVTVIRAWRGTTAAAHTGGAVVEVNPPWSSFQVLRALNQELDSYSSPRHGLYRVATVDITYSAARSGYDLTSVTSIIDILSVEAKDVMAGDRIRLNRWRLIRDADTVDFPSGKALYLYDAVMPGKIIEVAYKAPFTTMTTLATDLTATGLPATAYDIPPLGAAARLVAPREVQRSLTDAQPEPRRAADVPPGTSRQAAGGLLALRNQRLVEEAARLHALYPMLSRAV